MRPSDARRSRCPASRCPLLTNRAIGNPTAPRPRSRAVVGMVGRSGNERRYAAPAGTTGVSEVRHLLHLLVWYVVAPAGTTGVSEVRHLLVWYVVAPAGTTGVSEVR